jgi:hypothetical protein
MIERSLKYVATCAGQREARIAWYAFCRTKPTPTLEQKIQYCEKTLEVAKAQLANEDGNEL